jgi:hypothetical protein
MAFLHRGRLAISHHLLERDLCPARCDKALRCKTGACGMAGFYFAQHRGSSALRTICENPTLSNPAGCCKRSMKEMAKMSTISYFLQQVAIADLDCPRVQFMHCCERKIFRTQTGTT